MSDKMFWGAVGGVLVLVVAAFGFMVIGPMGQYDEAADKLKGRVKDLKKYAESEALPTDELVAAHESRRDSLAANIEAARSYYTARDERFEAFIGDLKSPDASTWSARQRDAHDAFFERYKSHTGNAELVEAPWDMVDTDKGVSAAQKEWRVIESLLNATLEIPNSKIRYCKRASKDPARSDHFAISRYTFTAEIAPSNLASFVQRLLSDPAVNFKVVSWELVKDLSRLTLAPVASVAPDTDAPSEPNVVGKFIFDVLDWDPPKEPKKE